VPCAVVCHRRINPFNQSTETSASDGTVASATADGKTFPVRFLGSQEVLTDRGTAHSVMSVGNSFIVGATT